MTVTSGASDPVPPGLEKNLRDCWDGHIAEYDAGEWPFAEWLMGRIQERHPHVQDLTKLHECLATDEIYRLSKALCADTNLPAFRRLLYGFIQDVLVDAGRLTPPLAVQRFVNVRVLLPALQTTMFPFHTGLLYGHGVGSRSVWMPLTDVSREEDGTASMQIVGLERSRALMSEAMAKEMSSSDMAPLFAREATILRAGPGKIVLFSQENIHGNVVNETGRTRVSIDFRIAEKRYSDLLARKPAGGYFHLLVENARELGDFKCAFQRGDAHNDSVNVIYLNNATAATEGAPVHLQRYMVYDYCTRYGLNYEFEYFELDRMRHLPTLHSIVDTMGVNTILYSVFALPEDRVARDAIVDAALSAGVTLHFVNEDLSISNDDDAAYVDALLDFAKFGAASA